MSRRAASAPAKRPDHGYRRVGRSGRHLTAVIVEHDMDVVFRIPTDRSMMHGEFRASGQPNEIKPTRIRSPWFCSALLGPDHSLERIDRRARAQGDRHLPRTRPHPLRRILARRKAGSGVLGGRNGAGKTTTIESIMGFLPLRSGQILIDDEDLTKLPPHERAQTRHRLFAGRMRSLPGTDRKRES